MLSGCNFLLLDEPTNHLDVNSREALENALSDYSGTVFVISHDRYLINKVATRLYKLSPGGAESINGGYDDFLAASGDETTLTAAKTKEQPAGDSLNKQDYNRRKQVQSDIRKLTTRVSRAEDRIAELETAISETNAAMTDPANAADYEKIAELSEKLTALQTELDTATEDWLTASEELEKLKNE